MSHTNQYKNLTILVNKRLKNSYITITKESAILIKTPYKSDAFIEKLLEEKAHWIEKQLMKLQNIKPISKEPLHSVEFLKDKLVYFAQEMSLDFDELRVKKMKSRWGSCSSKRVITLNSELTKLKEELIEYVVVHELAHLVHMNHSKEFHALVEFYLPNAKHYRKELREIHL